MSVVVTILEHQVMERNEDTRLISTEIIRGDEIGRSFHSGLTQGDHEITGTQLWRLTSNFHAAASFRDLIPGVRYRLLVEMTGLHYFDVGT